MKNKIVRQLFGITIATVMFAQMPMFVLADTYDISKGSITITTISDHEHQVTYFDSQGSQITTPDDQPDHDPVVTGTVPADKDYNLTINATDGDAYVTLNDLNIDVSGQNRTAAVTAIGTDAQNDVNIELEGTNVLKSGTDKAGLQERHR